MGPSCGATVEALSVDEVHDEKRVPVACRPVIEGVHPNDVRVAEREEDRHFAPESYECTA
jgi:hypothetical protein